MKFNQPNKPNLTVNLAGGQAIRQSSEMELLSLLLTSFASDQFYRKEMTTYKQLATLIAANDKEFVAKAIVYARKCGMRSITHMAASLLAKHISSAPYASQFFYHLVNRPDDMTEIASLILTSGKIPNSLKKGFAKAFAKFDRYQLAKYRMDDKKVKLVDIVNLVHPKPTEGNADALKDLVAGTLRSFDTWESNLSAAGSSPEKKAQVWADLVLGGKIGYFALLRNLRNIMNQSPATVPAAAKMLKSPRLIENSMVLPFRFFTAYDEIKDVATQDIKNAINRAVDISLSNVPQFTGKTLVAVDVSGSMEKYQRIAATFAAVLFKKNDADVMVFENHARYLSLDRMDTTMTIADKIRNADGGTNFQAIFDTANKKYDFIIILSDMQAWVGWVKPDMKPYKNKFAANPVIFSFDLAGYGTIQFPENNIYCLAGFSDKVFDVMSFLLMDRKALVNMVKNLNLMEKIINVNLIPEEND